MRRGLKRIITKQFFLRMRILKGGGEERAGEEEPGAE